VLVATDIAARGIHVDDIALVVHVDPPTEHKAYLHRSGRTARAGAGGTVVTIATPDQSSEVRVLAKQAGIRPTTASVRPGDAAITALTGPAAAHVEPAPVIAETPRSPRGTGGGRGRSAQPRATQAGTGTGTGSRSGSGSSGTGPSGTGSSGRSSSTSRAGSRTSGGPARTRAELAARAGQAPTRRSTGRAR